MAKSFNVVPLKDGLFKMGEDIVCAYPLRSTVIDLTNRKITYKYDRYDIEITWTETTPGTRTNPHWQRIYPNQGGNS